MSPSQASTPPATSTPAMRGADDVAHAQVLGRDLPFTVAAGKKRLVARLDVARRVSAMTFRTFWSIAYTNGEAQPWYAVRASSPPFSPAISTYAQAVPSG